MNQNSISYKCWVHSDAEANEKPSQSLVANNAREAAEKFAEFHADFKNKKFSTIKIAVKESNNHYANTLYYLVEVEIKPVFKASLSLGKDEKPIDYYFGEF